MYERLSQSIQYYCMNVPRSKRGKEDGKEKLDNFRFLSCLGKVRKLAKILLEMYRFVYFKCYN